MGYCVREEKCFARAGYNKRMKEIIRGANKIHTDYTSNADGQRVKSVINGETIYFVGGYYEKKGSEITKYYFSGASKIAMRKYIVPQTTTLTYLLGDHLGSTSLTVDADTGNKVETRYKPWGEVRFTTTDKTIPTRYTFTGQYSHISDEATDLHIPVHRTDNSTTDSRFVKSPLTS
jgi:hypothetical protein